jgi:pimeloyl-ACP methyl ester carboxylesterase
MHGVAKLPKGSVFRSVAGRAEFDAYYDRTVAKLPFPMQSKTVRTRFGATHLSIAGKAEGSPIVILPGMSIAGPMMLEYFALLADEHLLIAPDLIGQPGRSEDRPMPIADHGYGWWLADVLDQLGIERADMASASFGSSIALDLAAIAPERAGRMALVVPAGLTPRIPYLQIYSSLVLSWMAYRHVPVRRALPAIAAPLCRSLTEDNLQYLDIVIRQTAFWRHRPAGPFFAADLRGYRDEVFLVMARRDILFPHASTRANAHAALRIAEEVVLGECSHMPGPDEMAPIHQQIASFMRRGNAR